jgi:hypothetical protein
MMFVAVSCWKIRDWDLCLETDDRVSIFVKNGLWVLGLSDWNGNCMYRDVYEAGT